MRSFICLKTDTLLQPHTDFYYLTSLKQNCNTELFLQKSLQ